MGKGSKRRPGGGFEDNFDNIFGKKAVQRGRFIQHPETGKLIPAADYVRPDTNQSAYVMGDIVGFVSPIDRTLIDDRGKLRRHNAKHGVTNSADYSPEFSKNKQKSVLAQQARDGKADRIETIQRAIAHQERK